jgi:hypothetical protein
MIGRRALLQGALAMAAPTPAWGPKPMLPTVVMTFDTDVTTYTNALWIMSPAPSTGLPCIPGTFFADAYRMNTSGWPSKDNLTVMAMNKWEIGARVYGVNGGGGEINMVAALAANRTTAFDRLKEQRDLMYAQGFAIKSISAAQRAWSPQLRGLAAHLFENVRVCDHTNYGTLPIADRLYVSDGGSNSWSSSDTVASLSAWLDGLIAAGPNAVGIPIIHRVDTTGDPLYTISPTVFQGFISYLQSKITAGVVRAVTFREAVSG